MRKVLLGGEKGLLIKKREMEKILKEKVEGFGDRIITRIEENPSTLYFYLDERDKVCPEKVVFTESPRRCTCMAVSTEHFGQLFGIEGKRFTIYFKYKYKEDKFDGDIQFSNQGDSEDLYCFITIEKEPYMAEEIMAEVE